MNVYISADKWISMMWRRLKHKVIWKLVYFSHALVVPYCVCLLSTSFLYKFLTCLSISFVFISVLLALCCEPKILHQKKTPTRRWCTVWSIDLLWYYHISYVYSDALFMSSSFLWVFWLIFEWFADTSLHEFFTSTRS